MSSILHFPIIHQNDQAPNYRRNGQLFLDYCYACDKQLLSFGKSEHITCPHCSWSEAEQFDFGEHQMVMFEALIDAITRIPCCPAAEAWKKSQCAAYISMDQLVGSGHNFCGRFWSDPIDTMARMQPVRCKVCESFNVSLTPLVNNPLGECHYTVWCHNCTDEVSLANPRQEIKMEPF